MAFLVLVGMLDVSALEIIPLLPGLLHAAGLMVALGCVTLSVARRSIEYPVLAGDRGIVRARVGAVESRVPPTCSAMPIGEFTAKGDPFWRDGRRVRGHRRELTELITNNAAAVLMFPIAMAVAEAAASVPPHVLRVMVGHRPAS